MHGHITTSTITIFLARVSLKLEVFTQAKEILLLKRALLAWVRARTKAL